MFGTVGTGIETTGTTGIGTIGMGVERTGSERSEGRPVGSPLRSVGAIH
ncbi:MAG: hypothetical protein Q7R83_00925 [bacterium]|nr:hypothetical protein [bacterium]